MHASSEDTALTLEPGIEATHCQSISCPTGVFFCLLYALGNSNSTRGANASTCLDSVPWQNLFRSMRAMCILQFITSSWMKLVRPLYVGMAWTLIIYAMQKPYNFTTNTIKAYISTHAAFLFSTFMIGKTHNYKTLKTLKM